MPSANYEESFDESYVDLENPQEGGGNSSVGFGEVIRMLRRRLVLIAFTTAATTSVAYLYAQTRPPHYRGAFQIQVEPVSAEERIADPLALSQRGVSERTFQVDYPTQIAILKSPRVIGPVIEALQAEDGYDVSARDFIEDLNIEQVKQSRIISVRYSGSDPEKVGIALDRLVNAFLRYSLQERRSRVEVGIDFIRARREELEERAEDLGQELEVLQRQYTLLNIDSESSALTQKLQETSANASSVNQQLSEQRQYKRLLESQLGISADSALTALTLSEDTTFRELSQETAQLESQVALEKARFKDGSPVVIELEARRREILQLLQDRARQLLGSAAIGQDTLSLAIQDETRRGLARELVQVATQVELLEDRASSLETRADGLRTQITEFPEVVRRYADLSDELNSIRSILQELFAQEQRFSVLAAQSEVPWELITQPIVLDFSSSANRFIVLGLGGGLLLGAGLAFILDRMQDVSFEESDVADLSELLITVPDYEGRQPVLSWMLQEEETLKHAKGADPNLFEFLEAFNTLYARLLLDHSSDRAPLRSLGIASAGAGDGKTTIAVYLAYAIASAGRSVLLVDANLRSPCLHERLGLHNEQGLMQLLDNPSQALKQKSLLQSLPASRNLRVLTSGGVAVNAAQLLASEGMSTLMQKFRDKFDFVIYDTPELSGFADAQYIADRTNGLLLVTQLRRSKRTVFRETLETLQTVRLNVLGTIANAAHPKHAKDRNEGYEVLERFDTEEQLGTAVPARSPESRPLTGVVEFDEPISGIGFDEHLSEIGRSSDRSE